MLCQIVSLHNVVHVVSPPLVWSPLSSCVVTWYPSGDTRGRSVDFVVVGVPSLEPHHLSHITDYIFDFCPLPDPDVGISVIVCDV